LDWSIVLLATAAYKYVAMAVMLINCNLFAEKLICRSTIRQLKRTSFYPVAASVRPGSWVLAAASSRKNTFLASVTIILPIFGNGNLVKQLAP